VKPSRQKIHDRFCGTHGRCRFGPLHKTPISRACRELDALLDENNERVEDDRAHAEAEKLRKAAGEFNLGSNDLIARTTRAALGGAAEQIDPYEMRDGQLVRKSDGKLVTP